MVVSYIEEDNAGTRIDVMLLRMLKEDSQLANLHDVLSRELVKELLATTIQLNGKHPKPSYKVHAGDRIEYEVEKIEQIVGNLQAARENIEMITPFEGELQIIEETSKYLIINKPKGLSVQPGIGHHDDNLINRVNWYLNDQGVDTSSLVRSGLIHRLDRSVGGVMIFAKDRGFQTEVMGQFIRHQVLKIYHAISASATDVIGKENAAQKADMKAEIQQVIDAWSSTNEIPSEGWYKASGVIQRDPNRRKRMIFQPISIMTEKGRNSTSYIRRYGETDLLIRIVTGRTHQIRATLQYLGCPVDGDTLYSNRYTIPDSIELRSVVLGAVASGNIKVWRIE